MEPHNESYGSSERLTRIQPHVASEGPHGFPRAAKLRTLSDFSFHCPNDESRASSSNKGRTHRKRKTHDTALTHERRSAGRETTYVSAPRSSHRPNITFPPTAEQTAAASSLEASAEVAKTRPSDSDKWHFAIPSPVEMMTSAYQYIISKAEESTCPDKSLQHMTVRLDETQTQRRFTVQESPVQTDVSADASQVSVLLELENEPQRTRLASICYFLNPNEQRKLEDLQAEGEAKRAAFREELNVAKQKRTEKKRHRRPKLSRILYKMRFAEKENTDGKNADTYSLYDHARATWVITAFVVLIAVIYAIDSSLRTDERSSWIYKKAALGLFTWTPRDEDGKQCRRDARAEVWRYVTYQWFHLSVQHVTGNGVFLLVAGSVLEWTQGHRNLIVIMLVGGIAGGLAHVIENSKVFVAGASGCLYAVIGAHIANIVINWNTMSWKQLGFRVVFALAWITWETLVTAGVVDVEGSANISFASHAGGSVCGALLGAWLVDNVVLSKYDKYIKLTALAALVVSFLVAIVWIAIHDESTCPS